MESLQRVFGVNGASGKPLRCLRNAVRLYLRPLGQSSERAMRPQRSVSPNHNSASVTRLPVTRCGVLDGSTHVTLPKF